MRAPRLLNTHAPSRRDRAAAIHGHAAHGHPRHGLGR